jgi:hypothetical protein
MSLKDAKADILLLKRICAMQRLQIKQLVKDIDKLKERP